MAQDDGQRCARRENQNLTADGAVINHGGAAAHKAREPKTKSGEERRNWRALCTGVGQEEGGSAFEEEEEEEAALSLPMAGAQSAMAAPVACTAATSKGEKSPSRAPLG